MILGTAHRQRVTLVAILLLVSYNITSISASSEFEPNCKAEYHVTSSTSDSCYMRSNNCLTLSQFVDNSSDYLSNYTSLNFTPGNHSLEADLIVANVRSFSMLLETSSDLRRAVITCGFQARIEFINVSVVVVSGFEFAGCTGSKAVSISQLKLQNSIFHSQINLNGTVLTLDGSTATLDEVQFLGESGRPNESNFTLKAESCMNKSFGITGNYGVLLLKISIVTIKRSLFEGYTLTEPTATVINAKYGSDINIFNSTFLRNSVLRRYNHYCYSCGCTRSILNTDSKSTVRVCYSQFKHNRGTLINTRGDLTITHSKFLNNTAYSAPVINIADAKSTISHSSFVNTFSANINNSKLTVIYNNFQYFVLKCAVAHISHSEFTNITAFEVVRALETNITITNSKFCTDITKFGVIAGSLVNMTISYSGFTKISGTVICTLNSSSNVTIKHCAFNNNSVSMARDNLILLDGYEQTSLCIH